jgi:hypothetical protein
MLQAVALHGIRFHPRRVLVGEVELKKDVPTSRHRIIDRGLLQSPVPGNQQAWILLLGRNTLIQSQFSPDLASRFDAFTIFNKLPVHRPPIMREESIRTQTSANPNKRESKNIACQ